MTGSIVVGFVNYHSEAQIARCVESLERDESLSIKLAYVIVDNSSSYDANCWVGNRPFDLIRPSKNLGYAGAVNALIDWCRTNAAGRLLILNPDTEIYRGFLRALHNTAVQSHADVVTCAIEAGDSETLWYAGGSFDERSGHTAHTGYGCRIDREQRIPGESARTTRWASGACMLLAEDFLKRCPHLREDYFLYLEELEWQVRSNALVVATDFVGLRHYVGTSSDRAEIGLYRAHFFMARNRLKLRADLRGGHRWILQWVRDFIGPAIRRRNLLLLQLALDGYRARNLAPEDALEVFSRRIARC